MPYRQGPKVDPADVLPDGRRFAEHRRVQATAAGGQGPARPRAGRQAADLRHRRSAPTRPISRRSRRSSSRFATRTTACGRWSTRSCRARLFQTSRVVHSEQHRHDDYHRRAILCRAAGVSLALPLARRAFAAAPRRSARARAAAAAAAHGLHLHAARAARAELLSRASRQGLRAHAVPGSPARTSATTSPSSPACRIRTSGPGHDSIFSFLTAAPHPERRAGLPQQHLARSVRGRADRRRDALPQPGAVVRRASACRGRAAARWCRRTTSPSRVFARLFLEGRPDEVAGPGAPAARRPEHPRRGRRPGASRCRPALGAGDREKLDEYFTSVRELEQRLARSEEWSKKPKPQGRCQAAAGHRQLRRPRSARRG